MGKKKEKLTSDEWINADGVKVSGPADENFTYSFADLDEPGFDRGGIATSYTVEGLHFDDDPELREKYPALQQAHEHYLSVLEICKTKEKEEDAN